MFRKFIFITITAIFLGITLYFTFLYYATFSEGFRSGELIKISRKGVVFKTWEGELSQGVAGAHIFKFSILDRDKKVIQQMKELQGEYVKVTYEERYKTFPWWGDTTYFVTEIVKEDSPFKVKINN
ncbi:6-phosphogluconate dehydrogenase [Flavobacterium amniphilum]|uniref:6-phosphogluconate dehydrogenase n=1 Tax=Flavobacterium amniphilum TaxID=1834035 RepID=UPI00202AB7AA|nr:6-phosphogluconate dehydrogenase [Flavobacterium amniphilum]MCL9806849.1 6-phosphogluconate dehydrogenase [Flavobacterium amniphilum]